MFSWIVCGFLLFILFRVLYMVFFGATSESTDNEPDDFGYLGQLNDIYEDN